MNNRILIVDDTPSIHEDFRKILAPDETSDNSRELADLESLLFDSAENRKDENDDIKFVIDEAFQGEEAVLKVIEAEERGEPYALTFMDVRMPPGMDGVETIAMIWDKFPEMEIVICSAYSDYSWDQVVAKIGSAEHLLFLKKPFDPVELKQIAENLVRKWNERNEDRKLIAELQEEIECRCSELKQLKDELNAKNQLLRESVSRDPLTGLYNHVKMNDWLRSDYRNLQETDFPLSVLMMDLDNFREFNDVYGFEAGDEILRQTADQLNNAVEHITPPPSCYFIARCGGDKFALIVTGFHAEQTEKIAEDILTRIEGIEIPGMPQVKASMGIGMLTMSGSETNPKAILKLADDALYKAKEFNSRIHLIHSDDAACE